MAHNTIYEVVSDLPGWQKQHYYCLDYFKNNTWESADIALLDAEKGAREFIVKNVKWMRDRTEYFVGTLAVVEGDDFTWEDEDINPGVGRIHNVWNGLDTDETQEVGMIIPEMETRSVVKDSPVRVAWTCYNRLPETRPSTDSMASLVTFDLYTRYRT